MEAPDETLICTSHPATAFGAETTDLLSSIAGRRVVATGPPPDATSLEEIVDAIDTADPIVPLPHAQILADELPNAVFQPITGAGHVPVTERRNQVEQAVRTFLAS